MTRGTFPVDPIAGEYDFKNSRLHDLHHDLCEVLEGQLPRYLEEGWKGAESDAEAPASFLLCNPPVDFVFSVPASRWDELLDWKDIESDEKEALMKLHKQRARDLLITSNIKPEIPDERRFLVITNPDIEVWNWSRYSLAWFFETLAEDGLRPAEIIDFWMTEMHGGSGEFSAEKWGQLRGVQSEAVRKNCRQAHEKLSDELRSMCRLRW